MPRQPLSSHFMGLPPGVDSVQQGPVALQRRFRNLDEPVGVGVRGILFERAARFRCVVVVTLRVECEVGRARLVVRDAVVLGEAVEFAWDTSGCPASIAYMTASASSRFPGAVQATTHSPVSGLGPRVVSAPNVGGEVVPEPDVVGSSRACSSLPVFAAVSASATTACR